MTCFWPDYAVEAIKKTKERVVRMYCHVVGVIMQLSRESPEEKGGKKESLLH